MPPDREDRIKERAHQIWEREGRPENQSERHWATACQEIDAEAGGPDQEGSADVAEPPTSPGEGIDAIGEDGRSSAAEPMGRSGTV